jgi:hypothetical protein
MESVHVEKMVEETFAVVQQIAMDKELVPIVEKMVVLLTDLLLAGFGYAIQQKKIFQRLSLKN